MSSPHSGKPTPKGLDVRKTFILLLLCSFAMSGCNSSSSNSDDNKPVFAFVINLPGRFWDLAHAGCLKAAEEEGVEIEFHIPSDATAASQKQVVEALMSKGIEGMAISPLSPDSLSRLLDDAGEVFPVICQDSDAPNSKRLCYIGTDNVAFGRQQGELLKEALPEGGQVAVFVGQMDVANAYERHQGLSEALEGTNLEIVETFTDGGQRPRAMSNVIDALSKYPDLKAVVGLWGYNGPQAANALKDSDRDIVVISSDEETEMFEYLKNGRIYGSIAQQPFEFGYQSIKMLAKLHRGEAVEIPEDKLIFVPTYRIDQSNYEEVLGQIDEYMDYLE